MLARLMTAAVGVGMLGTLALSSSPAKGATVTQFFDFNASPVILMPGGYPEFPAFGGSPLFLNVDLGQAFVSFDQALFSLTFLDTVDTYEARYGVQDLAGQLRAVSPSDSLLNISLSLSSQEMFDSGRGHVALDMLDGSFTWWFVLSLDCDDPIPAGAHCTPVQIESMTITGASVTLRNVTFVPIPAALPLFASALLVLGFVVRRRRQPAP